MTSGVLVADMLEGTKFALGASMAVRKESFQRAGGFEELGQFYADDFVLREPAGGAGGWGADGDACDPADGAGDAVWAVVSEPVAVDAEHAAVSTVGASGVWTYVCGAVWLAGAGVGGAERPCTAWVWCGWGSMVLNRWLQAAAILRVMGDEGWLRGMLLYPLRDLLGSVLWLGSYGGDKFYYRGKIYTLKDGGRVEEPQ